mgnify:CR=1 FL=1
MAGAGGLQPRWKLNDIENELKTTTMENKQPELTRGEEEIMQILWRLGDAVVNEIIAQTKEPRPKYTTVATFLKRPSSKSSKTKVSSTTRPREKATATIRP